MKIMTLVTALVLLVAAPAGAQIGKVTAEAHEVRLSAMRLPQKDTGSLAFKKCDDCEYMTRLVTPATRWSLNNRNVTLREFKAGLQRITDRNNAYVTVVHHLESDRITAVAITVRQ